MMSKINALPKSILSFNLILFMSFALFVLSFFALSIKAEAFAEKPVAVIVFNSSGSLNRELSIAWSERVNRRFRFPDYKILEFSQTSALLKGNIPTLSPKQPYFKKEQMQILADNMNVEMIIVVWVNSLAERIVRNNYFSWRGEDTRFVKINMDITAYQKENDFYFNKKVRYSNTEPLPVSTPVYQLATQDFSDFIDKFKTNLSEHKM